MKFNAVHFYESPSRQGHPLAFTTKSEVTLQRPDKLRVIMSADGPASEFYYDGKKMMAYAPAENLVAVADAPPTIDAALEQAYHSAAIYFPFDDWIVADPYKEMSEGMNARLLHRSIEGDRRNDNGHGSVYRPRRVHTGVDWSRRQTTSLAPCRIPGRSGATAPYPVTLRLAT